MQSEQLTANSTRVRRHIVMDSLKCDMCTLTAEEGTKCLHHRHMSGRRPQVLSGWPLVADIAREAFTDPKVVVLIVMAAAALVSLVALFSKG